MESHDFEIQVNNFAVELVEIECQTSETLLQSSEEFQSYEESSDMQKSAGVLRPKGMQIGDEGGTMQAPKIGQPQGAQTTKAAKRPSFSFAQADFDEEEAEREPEEVQRNQRSQLKKELTKSMTIAEAKRQRAAALKKKMDEEYLKKRDPIREFFTLTCQSVKMNSPHMNLIA